MAVSFTDKETYAKQFNPRAYLEEYCSSTEGAPGSENFLGFLLRHICKTFTKGAVQGDTLIDLACGPTIYMLLSACEVFNKMILTDYCDSNLQEIEKWWKNEPGAFDWSPIVKYVCELEGQRATCREKEDKLRQTIKQVVKCDVTQSNPLEPLVLPAADCLLAARCFEAACKDQESYRAALKNILSLLKIGGHLVMTGVVEGTFYTVGQYRFSCLFNDMEFVKGAITDAGCIINDLQVFRHPESAKQSLFDNKGFFFLVAQKVKDVQ